MGRSYWFDCSKCGYRAKVSGGADRGLHFFVQTVACADCRQLHDVVIRMRVPEESVAKDLLSTWRRSGSTAGRNDFDTPATFESVVNRLLYRGVRRFRWFNFKLQCPVSRLHRVKSWQTPDKCPRCGTFLEQHPLPYRIWE